MAEFKYQTKIFSSTEAVTVVELVNQWLDQHHGTLEVVSSNMMIDHKNGKEAGHESYIVFLFYVLFNSAHLQSA
jgi:hypothetical protein